MTIVVGVSVNGVIGARSRPHIGQEILKLQPSLANRDAASTIIFECAGGRIEASPQHASPDCMFCQARVAVLENDLASETSAGLGFVGYELARANLFQSAAVALAHPYRLRPALGCPDRGKPIESEPRLELVLCWAADHGSHLAAPKRGSK